MCDSGMQWSVEDDMYILPKDRALFGHDNSHEFVLHFEPAEPKYPKYGFDFSGSPWHKSSAAADNRINALPPNVMVGDKITVFPPNNLNIDPVAMAKWLQNIDMQTLVPWILNMDPKSFPPIDLTMIDAMDPLKFACLPSPDESGIVPLSAKWLTKLDAIIHSSR